MTKFELTTALINTEKVIDKVKEQADEKLEKAIYAGLQVFCNILASELMKIKDKE